MMTEAWKDIPGYEGYYQASTFGKIRSLDKLITQIGRWGELVTRKYPGKTFIFKPHAKDSDYYSVRFNNKRFSVHTLILLTFKGPMPIDCDVIRHLDGKPFNNELTNLSYGTFSDNVIDIYRQGKPKGKLTIKQVIEIRKLFNTGISHNNIAWFYGVSRRTVSSIYEKTCYSWLGEDGAING